MKVLWLVPANQASWVIALSRALAKVPGISLTLLSTSGNIDVDWLEEDKEGIKFITVRTFARVRYDMLSFYLFRALRMKKALQKIYKSYDVIHIHGTEYQYQLAGAGIKDCPVIVSIQGLLTEYAKHIPVTDKRYWNWRIQSLYELIYMPRIKNYMCRTVWDKFHVMRLNPRAVIYHNWEMMRPEFYNAAAPLANYESRNIVFMGGTNSIKGISEALQVYSRLKADFGFSLTIIGRTDNKVLQHLLHRYSISNFKVEDIELLNFLEPKEITEVFGKAFCLLHPSYIDNSPNSISEAQLVGLPVVASDVGGVSSLIDSGDTGLLTTLDTESIYNAVKRLVTDKSLWQYISANGIAVARDRHNPEDITNNTIEIYRHLIAEYKIHKPA